VQFFYGTCWKDECSILVSHILATWKVLIQGCQWLALDANEKSCHAVRSVVWLYLVAQWET